VLPLVHASAFAEAAPLVEDCAAIDPDVALLDYLRAKLAAAHGDGPAAEHYYRRARASDLLRGRYVSRTLVPELPAWCASHRFQFVSVPRIVRRCCAHPTPGFDAFLDEIHYRPALHRAIAAALWETLRGTPAFAAAPPVTPEERPDEAIAQWDYTLIQTAVD